jgi:pre-60S factor REI1
MTGKGHCRFDLSEQDSEFAEFYDFSDSEPEDDVKGDVEGDGNEMNQEKTATSSGREPLLVDEDSIRLPSGKVISRRSPGQADPAFTRLRRRTRTSTSHPDHSLVDEEGSSEEELDTGVGDTRLSSKREKRERAMVTYQLANMSANDRNSLMHLPASQQRSILAAQHRHGEKVQKEERQRQSRIDRKGNKNLYAYWHTETPVYQCG